VSETWCHLHSLIVYDLSHTYIHNIVQYGSEANVQVHQHVIVFCHPYVWYVLGFTVLQVYTDTDMCILSLI